MKEVIVGSTADIVTEFRDTDNALTAIDGTPTITIKDGEGTEQVTDANLSKETTGRWVYYYDTSGTVLGTHKAIVTADVDTSGSTRTEKKALRFEVVSA